MLRQRVQVRFGKKGDLRFISHLDLMRTFERALRRTGLPLLMTDGFNPHPRMSFPLPLGVGAEGSDEAMEFELAGWSPPAVIASKLVAVLPSGLPLRSVETASPAQKARAVETTWVARPHDPADPASRVGVERLQRLLDSDRIEVVRTRKGRTKAVDVRPFVLGLRVEQGAIVMRFRVGPEGTTRPEEVLGALGFAPGQRLARFHIERTQVLLAAPKPCRTLRAGG